MKNNKYISLIITLACLLLTLQLTAHATAESFSWYCMRNKNHCQPQCEPNMNFINKYSGFFVDKKYDDNSARKQIYLTFDAGYENGNISKILDILKQKGVPAAFFILENIVKSNTELVLRMADEGHLVCNHTATHPDMTKKHSIEEFKLELERLENVYKEYTGRELAKYYRPPEGKFSLENLEYASALGYKTVFWSFAYADWDNHAQPSSDNAKKLILDNIHNGAVILLHPTSATNTTILPEIIDALLADGYTFGTLDQLTE